MDGKVTHPKPVNLVIDGARLRQLREAAGLSVSALARMAALSKNQIEQLESGGDSLFYNAGVKRQAARKLATLLGVDPKAVLTDPDEPILIAQAPPTITALGQDAPLNVSAPSGAEHITPSTEDPAAAPLSSAKSDEGSIPLPADAAHVQLAGEKGQTGHNAEGKKPASKTWLLMLLVLVGGLAAGGGFAWQQGLLPVQTWEDLMLLAQERLGVELGQSSAQPTPSSPVSPSAPAVSSEAGAMPAPLASSADPAPAQTPAAMEANISALAAPAAPDPQPICPVRQPNLSPSYAPQANKAGDRVHIIANQASTVCVQDATGEQWVLEVQPHVPRTIRGKSPWWIASHQIEHIQVFYQGWRVIEAKADGKQILLRERAVAPVK